MLRYSCLVVFILLGARQFVSIPTLSAVDANGQRETSLLLMSAQMSPASSTRGRQQPHKKQRQSRSMRGDNTGNTDAAAVDTRSIAACMLMKDDNHWLIEWLAFHYHVLPLRDLILVRDPSSKTSPDKILSRWSDRINIVEWDGNQVIPEFKWQQYRSGKIDDTRLHRARQQFFYADCLRQFQAQGKQWVLLTDTDEFIQPNLYALPQKDRLPLHEPGSVLRTIHLQTQLRRQRNQGVPKCLHIPRIQMASRQTLHRSNSVLPPLNTSHLLTTSWLHHNGQEIVQVPGANLDGKNILNVASITRREIPSRAHSVHMVIPKHCPSTNGNRLNHSDSWLVVYHYPGTYEQYTYRQDPRDTLSHRRKRWDLWKEMGEPNTTAIRDESMVDWLHGFVTSVGTSEAERLLRNAGVLETIHWDQSD